jgi:single-strand DNA-binding protein
MDTYITMHGNLVADPDPRSTAGGATVVGIRIASSGRRFDKASGEFRDGDTVFMSVSCWRTLGANVAATLRKGDSVVVHGRLLHRTYEDKQGIRRSIHEIDAIAVGPDLARCAADLRRPARPAASEVASEAASAVSAAPSESVAA